jgi:hypothetical protein
MSLKILPVKIKNKDQFVNIPSPLMKPPFLGVIVAGVKSGKSNLIINLIYRWYTLDDIFKGGIIIFSPNINNDDIFDNNIIQDENIIKFDQDLHEVNTYVSNIVKIQQEKQKDKRQHMLLIFDDCLGYISHGSYIDRFCTRYRQLKISMLFTAQVFRGLPNTIRSNASFMIFFKTYNQKELEKIEEEMGHIPDFIKYYNDATDEKYSFLYLNLRDLKLYKRFETLLWEK